MKSQRSIVASITTKNLKKKKKVRAIFAKIEQNNTSTQITAKEKKM